jgi:hypothetical protein
MVKYKYSDNGVVDTETGSHIPNIPGNRDWQEYLIWAMDSTTDQQFTQQELDDQAWVDLRTERDRLLSATDFMMTEDYYNSKMTSQEQTDVKTYRDDLRDLPADTSNPHNPTWPTKPQIVIDNDI